MSTLEVQMATIGAAVNEVTKARFEFIASTRRTTASRLAASLINDFLDVEEAGTIVGPRPQSRLVDSGAHYGETKINQVYVRLEPYYFTELGRLAEERNWYRGTYLANLLHAHVDRRPVLCNVEIDSVRQVARQLADVGRNINQIAKKLNALPGTVDPALTANVDLLHMLLELETAAVTRLLKANLQGWGVDDGEA